MCLVPWLPRLEDRAQRALWSPQHGGPGLSRERGSQGSGPGMGAGRALTLLLHQSRGPRAHLAARGGISSPTCRGEECLKMCGHSI